MFSRINILNNIILILYEKLKIQVNLILNIIFF